MAKIQSNNCPCGGANYASCCGRFIDGGELPDTAEQLMRSRYTAYTLRNDAYLKATWHASTRPTENLAEDDELKWLGLEVRRHVPAGDRATVEQTQSIDERSVDRDRLARRDGGPRHRLWRAMPWRKMAAVRLEDHLRIARDTRLRATGSAACCSY